MRLTILGSGSRGNAAVVQKNGRSILIDAGFSYRALTKRLKEGNISLDSITAVVVSHEHFDHVRGLGVFARIQRVPVYITEETFNNLYGEIGSEVETWARFFRAGERIDVNEIVIESFPVHHDAVDPVGFTFASDGKKIGFVTDIGLVTDTVVSKFRGASLVILEANHDVEMLRDGNYPEYLKQRIKGPFGHLSNDAALDLLLQIMSEELQAVYLSHISRENNSPKVAYKAVSGPLAEKYDRIPKIMIASQDDISESYTL